jgi:hypothetical protein
MKTPPSDWLVLNCPPVAGFEVPGDMTATCAHTSDQRMNRRIHSVLLALYLHFFLTQLPQFEKREPL